MTESKQETVGLIVVAWWGYLAVSCCLFFYGIFSSKTFVDWIELALAGWALVGLFGFVSRKRIGNRYVWGLCLGIYFLFFLLYSGLRIHYSEHRYMTAAGLLMQAMFFAPLFYGLYRYLRSSEIWRGVDVSPT